MASSSKNTSKTQNLVDDFQEMPTAIIVLGMAGSGKTTFVQRMAADISISTEKPPYIVNLDPAVADVPYPCNIDIRDTVEYRQIMKEYGLGPNGAIMTSLNLFSTKFDQVINILKNKTREQYDYIVVDTPG